ncbi:MAG TPA: hypothetical protein PLX71_00075 [Phycicoccus sp.]|nr:hypothetical protein [Phycicoccus sp.]
MRIRSFLYAGAVAVLVVGLNAGTTRAEESPPPSTTQAVPGGSVAGSPSASPSPSAADPVAKAASPSPSPAPVTDPPGGSGDAASAGVSQGGPAASPGASPSAPAAPATGSPAKPAPAAPVGKAPSAPTDTGEPTITATRSVCTVTITMTGLVPGSYVMDVWDDRVNVGSYPFTVNPPNSSGTVTHVIKKNVGSLFPGLGLYLKFADGPDVTSLDPWDFPGSDKVMQYCAASNGALDQPPATPKMDISRNVCTLIIRSYDLTPGQPYIVKVWDDKHLMGSYPFTLSNTETEKTVYHVLKANVSPLIKGLGIILYTPGPPGDGDIRLIGDGNWDFPGSDSIMQFCADSGGTSDQPKPSPSPTPTPTSSSASGTVTTVPTAPPPAKTTATLAYTGANGTALAVLGGAGLAMVLLGLGARVIAARRRG